MLDAYYPYGECNMLQIAFLASHLLRMMTFDDMELLYDMITTGKWKIPLRSIFMGMGVGCVNDDYARSAIAAGRLRELQVRDPLPRRHICIARSGETRSKAADELLSMILQGV